MIPISPSKILLVEWGEALWFKEMLQDGRTIEGFSLEDPRLMSHLASDTLVILSLAGLNTTLPECGLGVKIQERLLALFQSQSPVVAVLFGTPYALEKVPRFEGLVVAYENEREAQEAAAEILLGSLSPRGRLPVSILPDFPRGTGL